MEFYVSIASSEDLTINAGDIVPLFIRETG